MSDAATSDELILLGDRVLSSLEMANRIEFSAKLVP